MSKIYDMIQEAIKSAMKEGQSDIDKQIEDLRKAIWYIEDEIKVLEAKRS